jgi:hypothetical protein
MAIAPPPLGRETVGVEPDLLDKLPLQLAELRLGFTTGNSPCCLDPLPVVVL